MELEDDENEAELLASVPVAAPAISIPKARGAATREVEGDMDSDEHNEAGQASKTNGSTSKVATLRQHPGLTSVAEDKDSEGHHCEDRVEGLREVPRSLHYLLRRM